MAQSKGQLMSKCPLGVLKSPKKPTKSFLISALAPKKWLYRKSSVSKRVKQISGALIFYFRG